jgi:hypothetical protein
MRTGFSFEFKTLVGQERYARASGITNKNKTNSTELRTWSPTVLLTGQDGAKEAGFENVDS